jgi:hypothetical protein
VTPSTQQNYVRAQPFRPFRIVMNSGNAYDIRHAELIHIGKDFFNYYPANSPSQFPETWETVSLLLIENVQYLDAQTPKSNGPGGQSSGAT